MQKINVNILQKPKTIQTSVKNITPINPAKGTKTILQNGIHNIKEFEFISVNVKPDKLQEKEIEIVSNGKYEVTPDDEYFLTKVKVDVNVPIPDGYIIPEGTLEIKDNGTFDVRQFEYVLIDVPIPEEYIIPEGKINITNTQEVDVTQYAKAQVVDPNLKAENIAEGVEVLGITGTMKGAGGSNLKPYLDLTKSCKNMFQGTSITDSSQYLNYSDTENVTDMTYMFNNCMGLTTVIPLDTSKVTNMSGMFNYCYNLTAIPHLNTSNVTNMNNMFARIGKLTTIPQLDTSKVTNISYMFYSCSGLTAIPQLDTSSATDMSYMFASCKKLISIPQLDTSKVTNTSYMFNYCSSLQTIPQLDTSKVTNMYGMFSFCSDLQTIPQLDTSNATNMAEMFNGCRNLISIPQLDTSKVTYMNYMFQNCDKLVKVDISYFNASSPSSWCNGCINMKAVIIRNFGTKYSISTSTFSQCYAYIYVPRNMVDTLKSATNWSTHADQIRALEDYTVDGTTTGAFDDAKAGL